MSKVNSLIWIILLSAGCSFFELQTTQQELPVVQFDETSVSANGSSKVSIKVVTKNPVSGQMSLSISTTNGKLFTFPLTGSGASSLTLVPNSTSVSFLLKSSLIPDDNVIISTKVGNLVQTSKLQFQRSCPDEIQPYLDRTDLSIENDDVGNLTLIFLRNDEKKVSSGTRVDLSISDSFSSITQTVFSDSLGTAIAQIKPLEAGVSTIKMKVVNIGCDASITAPDLKINIKN